MSIQKTRIEVVSRDVARRSVVASTSDMPIVEAVNEEGEIVFTFTLPAGLTRKFSEYVDLVPEAVAFEVKGGLFVYRGVSETIRTEGHRKTSANPNFEQPRLDMQMLLMQREMQALRNTVSAIRSAPADRPAKRAVTREAQKQEIEKKEIEIDEIKEIDEKPDKVELPQKETE